jgi:hypothetical protein
LDSEFAKTTLAPATALPLGSTTVPRTDVVACPQAEVPAMKSARSARAIFDRIHEACGRHASEMREDAHDSPQESRAAPDAPFVLCDFFVLMICTLAFPSDHLGLTHFVRQA